MAQLRRDGNDLVLELTGAERLWALRRRAVRVPLSSVRSAEVVAEPLRAVRGLRAPGLHLPGFSKIGTWRRRGGRTFAVARAGRPGVHVRLAGQPFTDLVASLDEPSRAVEAVRASPDR